MREVNLLVKRAQDKSKVVTLENSESKIKRLEEIIKLYEENAVLYRERLNEVKKQLKEHEAEEKCGSCRKMELLEFQPLKKPGIKIPCLYELDYCYKSRVNLSNVPIFKSSLDAYKLLLNLWSNKIDFIEEAIVLFLNRTNRVISHYKLSSGGHYSTIVESGIIFQAGLIANASKFILCHNHPGGDPYPSDNDNTLTKEIEAAGKLIGIRLTDHIIITRSTYFSYKDEGYLNSDTIEY